MKPTHHLATSENTPSRRTFLKQAAAGGLALASALPTVRGEETEKTSPARVDSPMVGVQIAPHSLFDEGIEAVLDLLQETAAVNTLFVLTHGYYGSGPKPPAVLADHGAKVRTDWHRLPKLWVKHDPKYFRQTTLRHLGSGDQREYGDRHVLEELQEPLKRREMKVYARFYEPKASQGTGQIANWERIVATDMFGEPGQWPCWNKPEYREFVRGTVEDLMRNHPLDGLQYGAERTGPLSSVLLKTAPAECFCEDCIRVAGEHGIDLAQARLGYRKLYELMKSAEQGQAPGDGILITVLRLFQEYPETLAWNRRYLLAGQEINDAVYQTAKAANPQAEVGQHVDHQQSSWDPFFRSAISYERMAQHNDFIKLIVYHDIFGPRLRWWVLKPLARTLLSELSHPQSLQLFYSMMGLDGEQQPDATKLGQVGLTTQYVHHETHRCVSGIGQNAKVYSGIGFDVPWHGESGMERFPSEPENVYQAVTAAMKAGAAGVVASREYDEMRRENLAAFGRAVRREG